MSIYKRKLLVFLFVLNKAILLFQRKLSIKHEYLSFPPIVQKCFIKSQISTIKKNNIICIFKKKITSFASYFLVIHLIYQKEYE